MRSLEVIIQELKKDLPNKDRAQLSNDADDAIKEAIEITRNQKAMHSGSLETLTNDLAELINLFPDDIPLDDLRYHLAHLYMRSQKWKEAENQLVGIQDYLYNEAQIYSALCAFKQADQLDRIQADIERIAKELCNSKSVRTKAIQEQQYNLLEMLVYACGLNNSVLETYYMTGLTRFDLGFRYKVKYFDLNVTKVDLKFGLPKWLLAEFRLLNLLKLCKEKKFLVILDLTEPNRLRQLECYRSNLREPVRIMATKLANKFPHSVPISDLIDELKDYLGEEYRNVINISTWKGQLCNFIKTDLSGKDNAIITERSDEKETSKYKLNHSFILVQNPKR